MGATKTETKITIDNLTGEIITEENVKVMNMEFEPRYIKMYVDDIVRLNGISPTCTNIIFAIARRMGSKNEVALIKGIKETIALECGVSLKRVDNMILELKKNHLLIAIPNKRSCYILDPHLFSRESWKENKALRLQVTYLPDYNRKVIQAGFSSDIQPELPFEKADALARKGWED